MAENVVPLRRKAPEPPTAATYLGALKSLADQYGEDPQDVASHILAVASNLYCLAHSDAGPEGAATILEMLARGLRNRPADDGTESAT